MTEGDVIMFLKPYGSYQIGDKAEVKKYKGVNKSLHGYLIIEDKKFGPGEGFVVEFLSSNIFTLVEKPLNLPDWF